MDLKKSWKTNAIAVLVGVAGFISYSPEAFGGESSLLVQLSKYLTTGGGGVLLLGLLSKDFDVSGFGKKNG
ncbi:MAG TPA: hypothetical protein V6C46_07635 [Coleofasciculaceae cyanobacterium]